MKLDAMQLSLDTYVENANTVKDQVIVRLVNDKIITEEQGNEYLDKWQMIVFKNAWYKRWWKKFNSTSGENDWCYKFVKIQN
jgi:hypothetical protein